jgi:hypothetical protein
LLEADHGLGPAGPYRTLAQKAVDEVKKGDLAVAGKLAQTLEMDWDANESALHKSAPDVWSQVDDETDKYRCLTTRLSR